MGRDYVERQSLKYPGLEPNRALKIAISIQNCTWKYNYSQYSSHSIEIWQYRDWSVSMWTAAFWTSWSFWMDFVGGPSWTNCNNLIGRWQRHEWSSSQSCKWCTCWRFRVTVLLNNVVEMVSLGGTLCCESALSGEQIPIKFYRSFQINTHSNLLKSFFPIQTVAVSGYLDRTSTTSPTGSRIKVY